MDEIWHLANIWQSFFQDLMCPTWNYVTCWWGKPWKSCTELFVSCFSPNSFSYRGSYFKYRGEASQIFMFFFWGYQMVTAWFFLIFLLLFEVPRNITSQNQNVTVIPWMTWSAQGNISVEPEDWDESRLRPALDVEIAGGVFWIAKYVPTKLYFAQIKFAGFGFPSTGKPIAHWLTRLQRIYMYITITLPLLGGGFNHF